MTLEQYINVCRKAISANFKHRNIRVFSDHSRQLRMRMERGNQIRGWITELRAALDPATQKLIAEKVLWRIH